MTILLPNSLSRSTLDSGVISWFDIETGLAQRNPVYLDEKVNPFSALSRGYSFLLVNYAFSALGSAMKIQTTQCPSFPETSKCTPRVKTNNQVAPDVSVLNQ